MGIGKHFDYSIIAAVLLIISCGVDRAYAIPPNVNHLKLMMADGTMVEEGQRPRESTVSRSMIDASQAVAGTSGADTCAAATVTPVAVGSLGSPLTTVINGDNSSATMVDCAGLGSVWWEAFEVTECARVTLDFCGTSPGRSPDYSSLASMCPCGGYIAADFASRAVCGDNNITITYDALPAGIYYYNIFSDDVNFPNSKGPYQLNITAEKCLGACCNLNDKSCVDGVTESSCTLPDEVFGGGVVCCELECRDPVDEFDALGVSLLSQVPLVDFSTNPSSASDVWGYVSDSGREYALMGLACAVAVVEVTDPENPVIIDELSGPCSVWRDIRTFGHYAYVVIEQTGNGMQILNLSNVDAGVVSFVGTVNPGGLQRSHNIATNEESGFAYVVLGSLSPGIAALDMTNPTNPIFVGSWNSSEVHDVQVVSYTSGPFAAREIAFASSPGVGLTIVDVTDKANMFTVSTVNYPNEAYAHQGWLSKDRKYFFLGDEADEIHLGFPTTTYVIDVQDIENPFMLTSYVTDFCAVDHNMITRGNHLYQANYSTGLRVLNVSDPANITEVGYFDTHPEDNVTDYVGAWGVYPLLPSGNILISDIQRGLFVLDVTEIVKGACCDLANQTCANNVDKQDCQGLDQQWSMDQTCSELDCGPLVPTVSQWGLILLTLLMMIGGTLVLKRETIATS